MIIIITALKYKLSGGEAAVPAFQQSHPAGTPLQLSLNGPNHPYPGSVEVWTEDFEQVGLVAAEDLHMVRPLFGSISEGGNVEGRIHKHLPMAIMLEVDDVDPSLITSPLFHAEAEAGEMPLAYTPSEMKAQHVGDRLEQLLKQQPSDPRILTTLQHYKELCCYSLAGDDFLQRRRISILFNVYEEQLQPEVKALATEFTEYINDFKHPGRLWECYESQMADISRTTAPVLWQHYQEQHLADPNANLQSLLTHLEDLLDHSTNRLFTCFRSHRDEFATRLFYLMPDRSTLYLILGRLYCIDQLSALYYERVVLPMIDAEPDELPVTELFLQRLKHVLNTLISQVPSTMDVVDPLQRGRKVPTAIVMQPQVLHSIIYRLEYDWQQELEAFIDTRRPGKGEPFNSSLPYRLLGWLRRKTQLFGRLPKKDMARLLSKQVDCEVKFSSLETYISRADDDELILDEYPLMIQLTRWLSTEHPSMLVP